ncbi:hypothetical protein [Candidatus Pollutiaquabacter sp.]|uniref:hypothetical protein n=1 Tax=Candidatus Pollutiaquabacter sp. TaxID=3416354 RepID=UPI003D131CDD
MPELGARIKSVFRRRSSSGASELVFHELKVMPDEMMMYVNDKMISLTKKSMNYSCTWSATEQGVEQGSHRGALAGDHADMADSFDFIYSHIKNLRKENHR